MRNLINIETKNINGELIQAVNARDLHSFLGILVGVFFNFCIPSLNSILVAGGAYWVLIKV